MRTNNSNEMRFERAPDVARVREAYSKGVSRTQQWDLFGRCAVHEREEQILHFLLKRGVTSLRGLRVLDVGCGAGALLRRLLDWGAEPENCVGVDIQTRLLEIAKTLSPPTMRFVEASATELPFANQTFDVAMQFTMFTSILDINVRIAMAAEILRTLKTGGLFIWYDFAYSNPASRHTRGIGRREIRSLLTSCRLQFERVTLAPPIGRPAARLSPVLYHLLSSAYFLRSHYLCFAEKV